MGRKEDLQESIYVRLGDYHRQHSVDFLLPFHPDALRYQIVLKCLHLQGINVKGESILDYGGGDAAMATMFANSGAKEVIVFDRSRLALSFASKDKRLKLLEGETFIPSIENEAIGIVSALEVLEHIDDTHEQSALSEISRILRKNGVLVISVPSSNRDVSKKHYRHYSANTLVAKLGENSFKIEKVLFVKDLKGNKIIKGMVYAADWIARNINGNIGVFGCQEQEATSIMVLARKVR